MSYTEALTKYIAHFVDELFLGGMTDVVISPGSRSTPLAMTFAEHPSIKHWVNLDERSAAFFALGIAKKQRKPVALVCTSGTAAANYLPAIVEAYYSRVPLLILTADRPHELREVGAPQAIDQIKMYGDFVKWFHEMALPESTETMLNYVRGKGARAIQVAMDENQGPVHLNFPLREPLIPDFNLIDFFDQVERERFYPYQAGKRSLTKEQLNMIVSELKGLKHGLIVCGPQDDECLADAITELALALKVPILADPLSQLRSGNHNKLNIIETYDTFLKGEKVKEQLAPEFIIRFGAMPVSKPYLLFQKKLSDIKHILVEPHEGYREPTNRATTMVFADPTMFCQQLRVAAEESDLASRENWLQKWQNINEVAKQALTKREEIKMTEGHLVQTVINKVPNKSIVYVGNSMPIRDLDTFLLSNDKSIRILANRGANGIDGLVSSALGAASDGEHVTLIIGDLSFYHDFNGLLAAKQSNISLTIILINNNGGGIFSFLPQANQEKHFEVLFGTPLNIEFDKVVEMYGGSHRVVNSWCQFEKAVETSYQEKGLSVIEARTIREENVEWHRSTWRNIEQAIQDQDKG